MANQKIIEIIGAFSPEEKEEFLLFLQSPYFLRGDGGEEMLRLYDFLMAGGAEKQGSEKPAIHTLLFPGKNFSVSRLDRAYARFLQLAEQFLLTQSYEREENEQERALELVRIFRAKGLTSRHEKKLQALMQDAERNPLESTEHHLFRYRLAKELHVSKTVYNTANNDLAIPQLLHALQLFYCNELNDRLNWFLLQQKAGVLQTSEHILFALESAKQYDYLIPYSPLLEIRRSISALFLNKTPDPEGFEALIQLLEKYKNGHSFDLNAQIYGFIRSYCSILINFGKDEFRPILHKIQKGNLDKGYFYSNGKIMPFAMLSITRVAVVLKEVEWARMFVEAHRDRIWTNQDHEEIYRMNLAVCFFGEKKFEQVLQHISLTIKNHIYLMFSKRLEIMAYFELRSELFIYKIDAFRKYLERTASQKSPSLDWTQHHNFYKILFQIYQSESKNTRRKLKLIERIKNIELIAERNWLLEKAQELA